MAATQRAPVRVIIDLFGGTGRLADRLGCRPSAVSNWLSEGLPRSRMGDLLVLADQEGIDGIDLALLQSAAARSGRSSRNGGTK